MQGDNLTLERDENDRAVWLITASKSGMRHKEIVWLREGFGLDDVREAIIATGCVKEEGDQLRFTSASDSLSGPLSKVIEEMFGYFSAPGAPTSGLLEVQSAVGEYEVMRASKLDIPLYAYAWLDLIVREDIADEARSATHIWTQAKVAIEMDRCCDRRVKELVSRHSQPATRNVGRMAGSVPTRDRNASRDTKTG